MAVADLPLVSMLRTRMQWHQARQKVLAENVANADTPGFRPKDLAEPRLTGATAAGVRGGGLALAPADGITLAGIQSGDAPGTRASTRFETKPSGNAVSLEEEMMRVAQNQSDYALAASLYEKSLKMLRTAAGKR
jgi:flagellar basal-body rod protein FlgB